MKKFLVIYGLPAAAIAEMKQTSTPEEMKQGMEDWKAWMADQADHMIDPGNPVGKNTRLTKDGAQEVANEIAGYSIFQGESKAAVVELVKSNPHFMVPRAYLEVMEIVDMM